MKGVSSPSRRSCGTRALRQDFPVPHIRNSVSRPEGFLAGASIHLSNRRVEAGEVSRVDGAPARKDSRQSSPLPGQVIQGRYRVIAQRGTGRLATVYLGEEVTTAKKVALKVFHRELAKDEDIVEQLRRQAKLAAALSENHPRIATVYECDRTEDGSVFIVMEYLDGRSLKDVIRQEGPLEVDRALRLAGQIAEGLEAAHAMGLVHTDIRPQNVMVHMEAGEEAIKLKGFEAAGLRETRLVDHLIRAGVISGNPEYAAPEQIEGAQITARTDVYSFGVLLYEMLTGVVPFRGSSPDGVLARHLQETPPPLGDVRPEVPSVVEVKVGQALEKEPEKRQRHAVDVINENLYASALDESRVQEAQQKYGVLWNVIATAHAWIAGAREIATDPERVAARWMVLGVSVWLLLVSASAVWMLSSRQTPMGNSPVAVQQLQSESRARDLADRRRPGKKGLEPSRSSLPPMIPSEVAVARVPPQQPPQEARAPDLTPRSGSGKERMGTSILPVPRQPSINIPRATSIPQKTVRRPDRADAPTSGHETADLTGIARAPSAPRQEASRPDSESPDPTAIIDWVLQQSPAKNR